MIPTNLIVCLSMVLVTNVSGNMFNPFSSFPGFSSFPRFNPFGSYGSPFGSGFPFGQSFGSPFSSDDPFTSSSPFPFQPQTQQSFPSPFNRGFSSGSFGFPFPSFTDFTNGMASGDLKGNGIKVTSTSSGSKSGANPGQVIQTIKVEKIGSENGPGEERRIVQTFRASGPLVTATGLNSQGSKGANNTKNQRVNGQRPIKLTNNNQSQQRIQPQRPLKPNTPITPPNGLKVNGTQSTSVKHSSVLNSSVGKPSVTTNNQLALNSGANGTGAAPKVSSSSSTSTSTNKSSASQSNFNSQTSRSSSTSNQSASSSNGSGVTVRRIDSSGRVINGY